MTITGDGMIAVTKQTETYICFGIETKRNLNSMTTDANVLNVLSDAIAYAEAMTGTANGALTRLLNGMRKTAVKDAIRFELNTRMNNRIASGKQRQGDKPRLPNGHLSSSIENARRHAAQMADMTTL